MAIAGLLVHCANDARESVENLIRPMRELTLFGTHLDQYIVVVAETPSSEMEACVDRLGDIEGILAVYTTFMSFEDELPDVLD